MSTDNYDLAEIVKMDGKRKEFEQDIYSAEKRPARSILESIDATKLRIVTSTSNFEAVLSDDFYVPTPLIPVYVGKARDPKQISKIILTLNEKIPLKELSHLKRAKKQDILLCPTNYLNGITQESIQEYIEQHIYELKESFEYFKVIEVPSLPSKLKVQQVENGRKWSCNFHPNMYLEKLFHGIFFKAEEIKAHRLYMAIAYEVARFYLSKLSSADLQFADNFPRNFNASVVVDPSYQSIVAVAYDYREVHPLQHTTMLAIDNVAKTQNGGAWNINLLSEIDMSLAGIDKELYRHLKNMYPSVKFGARNYVCKSEIDENNLNASDSPYLCTGYYIYVIKEPCVMCAMGLVHARINRVFYDQRNELSGALGSVTKLHCVPSLNHHFEVFTKF